MGTVSTVPIDTWLAGVLAEVARAIRTADATQLETIRSALSNLRADAAKPGADRDALAAKVLLTLRRMVVNGGRIRASLESSQREVQSDDRLDVDSSDEGGSLSGDGALDELQELEELKEFAKGELSADVSVSGSVTARRQRQRRVAHRSDRQKGTTTRTSVERRLK